MINIAIVEDNENDFNDLNNCLNQYQKENNLEFSIVRFNNAESFLAKYDYSFNIIFMDILLDTINGLEACKKLREKDHNVIIVFVTNMSNLAVDGYLVNASDFIVKPISYWNFTLALKRILPSIIENEKKKFVVNDGDKKVCISIFDVLYISVNDHVLNFITKNNIYLLNGSLKDMQNKLFNCGFCLSDSSYLVNLRYVKSIKKDMIVLTNDMQIPLSRRKKKDFLICLNNFIGEKL